jgi:trigger factor
MERDKVALVEGCKHEIEITIPVDEVDQETEKVVADIQKKVRLPGFRPGKAPASLVRSKFQQEIRQDVLENLLPRYFRKKVEEDNLQVVGQPSITDVHFHKGEPLRFKAEFEVAPAIELGEYRGVTVEYAEPAVSDQDVEERLERIRDQKAEYINVDPRPIEEGDYAVISLKSTGGVEPPVEQDELSLHIGGEDTIKAFTENLLGAVPGDEKDFPITYPDDFGQERLAGKTIDFHVTVTAIRRKELPEANDEFARDLGDYQTLDELKDTIRKTIFREREIRAQNEAKDKLVDKLVDSHEFPVPDAYVERQIESQIESQLRTLASQGIDPRQLKVDWEKIKEGQRPRAIHDVKASLILDRIAEREAIEVLQSEVDHEVQRIAKQRREAVAVVRPALEKDGTIRRIAQHIRTEKTLNMLFENARKEAPKEVEGESKDE